MSSNVRREAFSLSQISRALDIYRLSEQEARLLKKFSSSSLSGVSLFKKELEEKTETATDERRNGVSVISLSEKEIFNHIYLSLFNKSKWENFTCMLESRQALDQMNARFSYANYEMLLDKVGPYLANKSANGVTRCYFTAVQINISQLFKSMDKDFDRRLSFSEFYNGLLNVLYERDKSVRSQATIDLAGPALNLDCQLELDERAIVNLFNQFDVDNDGFVGFAEFVRAFNVPMCQQRIAVLHRAFDKLDSNKDGYLDRSDVKYWLMDRPSIHSLGIHCDEFVEKAISLWMINFRDPKLKQKPNRIDRDSFILYYTAISSTIIDDSYFDLLIKHTFNIV